MTPESINIACAELDGKGEIVKRIYAAWSGNERGLLLGLHAQHCDYTESYDAILPLIQKVLGNDETLWKKFFNEIGEMIEHWDKMLFSCAIAEWNLTTEQLATALVKACGKWKE